MDPNPPSYSASQLDNSDFQNAQRQVEEVVTIMRNNVSLVVERDEKLSELDSRAATLEACSSSFATSSQRLRRKQWWQNMKMKLIIGGILLLVLTIIAVILIINFSDNSGSKPTSAPVTTSK